MNDSIQLQNNFYTELPCDFYKSISKTLNPVRRYFHEYRLATIRKLVEKFYEPGQSIADAGCGNCMWNFNKLPVIGIDINKKYLDAAKRKSRKLTNVKFIHVNAEKLIGTFEEDRFQKSIALWNTMACVSNDQKCIKQIASVVRDGFFFTVNKKGTLKLREKYYKTLGIKYRIDKETETIFSSQWGATRAYSRYEIEKMVKNSGFKISKIQLIFNIIYAVYLEK